MVRDLYEAAPQQDPQLLSRALPLLLREHAYWNSPPKQVQVAAADGTVHNMSRSDDKFFLLLGSPAV
jgi:hypothetical protein